MQTKVCRSPVEVETRQILTPLSGLRLTPVVSLMSIPRRAERLSLPHRPIQPRPANVQRIVIRTADPECSSSSTTREDWARSRRELLRRKFEQRPSRERLVTQNILLSDGRVSPLIEQQARALRQNRIKNCLSRKLGQRPGPLELVTRKILQVDAELENAIQEGRLHFTPTTENDLQEVEDPPTPITTDMEVVATVKQPPKSLNSLTNKGILRKPTKPNPYKPFEQAAARAKTKTADSRLETLDDGPVRTNQIPRVDDHNNYELRLQQQQLFLQWQSEGGVDSLPNSETTLIDQGSSTPTNGIQMPRKLSDLKVQELKNECKKRQLPVSGPKPQLLERLRGFEKDILGATPPPSPPIQKEDHAFVDLSDKSIDSHMMPHCNGVSRQCSPPEIIFQSETPMRSQLQQKEYVQPPPQMRIQQLVPVQGNGSQLVQLIDERGNVLGMGTVQLQPDNGTQTVVLQQRIVSQPLPQQQVEHHSVTIASQPRLRHSALTPQLQKQQDGTYCFAQMGSGGHFTAVQPNEIVVENNQHKLSAVQSPPMILNTVMAPPAQRVAVSSNKKQTNIAQAQPAGQGLMSPHVVVTFGQKCQAVQEIQRPQQLTGNRLSSPKLQGSPRIADHPECSPSMPMSESRGTDSCTPIEVIKTKDETITLDPNDPASVLTPTTLQMHEDMLRKQHKMIQALEHEITFAQEMLRKRQQIILAAKKTQQKLRERQRVETEEDTAWVNNMDIRNMNKTHIQSFLQHKNHINKLTSISKEHNRLKTTEERLQEELHVDQAVHDIVRLIKQDPRTALLIVQLLRKYQLERTHTDVVANTSEQTEEEVIEMSSVETLNKQLDSVQSDISGRKSSFGSDTSTSSSLSHCSQEILMSDGTKRILPGQQLQHTNTVYYAEPMDDKPDMEAVFKNVIDNASRLTSDGHLTPEQNVDCSVSAVMDSPKQTSDQLQWNALARQTVYVVQNQDVDHDFKAPKMIVQRSQIQKSNFAVVHQVQMVQQQEKSGMEAYDGQFNETDFNPTLDDVMAVVQADTDFSSGGESFNGGEYGSEALAQFLGEDWLNMANQNISHDGQYVPYNQDESGRSTDPMSMGIPMDTNEHDWLDEFLIREPVDT